MRTTLSALRKKLAAGKKISMLTCYDAGFARVMDEAGVDTLLVGDSLGMVVQGRDSTLPVRLQDIAYHVECIARGSRRPFLVADMPFGTYQEGPAQALRNAVVLMQAGAQMVKLEGGAELAPTIELLVRSGIPVCGHIGLLPSHVHALGGYRVQGKESAEADRIVADARAVQAAGAAMLVIEAVPDPVARQVCAAASLITIGIGASVACSGQVLVMHDMLGLTASPAKFVKNYMVGAGAEGDAVAQAFRRYAQEVESGAFPGPEHVYGAAPAAIGALYGQRGA
ncbi:3-methyl-2-oxobutanoate hydroxymethyltransferase [Pigmentiphaga humi]|uniref:3-methyl-2-oxobutanoate hydroxymethyltransferase n=1 Tax=Pigmentiphaga humi TaxID=2478468 RepID=A0A3P4B0M0_9BURK|nr:3-methyl-2-oxobutanoate hydroxymethyltransferase [Pigmentiphaga humi]VCU69839.1 3-methyl-2-oxobutanoate hydroxymethyltransferase [Pigmentiphaga humi]